MGQGYEKISSPDQIKNFQSIKKEGNSLFGIRKSEQKKEQPNKANPAQSGNALNGNSNLEKISSPADIPLFEKIEKRGNALWGVRKDGGTKYVPVYVTPEAVQCVKDAMDKKDVALKAATTKHDASVLAALDTRNVCQKTALSQITAQTQFDTNKTCVNNFLVGLKEINKIGTDEKGVAKKVFVADLKVCTALLGSGSQDIMIEDGGDIVEGEKQQSEVNF